MPVIPAKAGIQCVESAFPKVCRVDSRFRGNDRRIESIPKPNEASTRHPRGVKDRRNRVI
jgi:hypothetical protein